MERIILASGSPRRKELLERMGISFDIVISEYEENMENEISPYEMVKEFSYQKARAVLEKLEEPAVVVGADTVVVYKGKILGKPKSDEEAFQMLKMLQGKRHAVYTGVAILTNRDGEVTDHGFVDSTDVYMRSLSDEEIQNYVNTGEPRDKAGAYGIQEKGSLLVEKIEGDYNTVVGLPIVKVYETFKKIGLEMKAVWMK